MKCGARNKILGMKQSESSHASPFAHDCIVWDWPLHTYQLKVNFVAGNTNGTVRLLLIRLIFAKTSRSEKSENKRSQVFHCLLQSPIFSEQLQPSSSGSEKVVQWRTNENMAVLSRALKLASSEKKLRPISETSAL